MAGRITFRLITTIAVVVMAFPSFGQSRNFLFKAKVPFEFFVGDKLIPAGEYVVQRTGQHGDAIVFRRTPDLHSVQMQLVNTRDVGKIEISKLVFRHYGTEYFLSEVWSAGEDRAGEIMQGKREMQLARRTSPAFATVMAGPPTGSGK